MTCIVGKAELIVAVDTAVIENEIGCLVGAAVGNDLQVGAFIGILV